MLNTHKLVLELLMTLEIQSMESKKDFGHIAVTELLDCTDPKSLFVWGFMPYQQHFSYLAATVHKSMFPGLFLTNT